MDQDTQKKLEGIKETVNKWNKESRQAFMAVSKNTRSDPGFSESKKNNEIKFTKSKKPSREALGAALEASLAESREVFKEANAKEEERIKSRYLNGELDTVVKNKENMTGKPHHLRRYDHLKKDNNGPN